MLCKIEDYDLSGFTPVEVYILLKYYPKEDLSITFTTRQCRCIDSTKTKCSICMKKIGERFDDVDCCKKKKGNKNVAHSQSTKCQQCISHCRVYCQSDIDCSFNVFTTVIGWIIQLITLTLGVKSTITGVLDQLTDYSLLIKAAGSDATMYTIISVLSILAPYILRYVKYIYFGM